MRIVKGSLKIPIGVTHYRRPVFLNLATIPHTKIAGVTGSGKSEVLKAILYFLCQQVTDAEIHIIDLKGGATYIQFTLLPQVKRVYRNTPEALAALRYCEVEMRRRQDEVLRARIRFEPVKRYPLLVLVIDEGGEMSPADALGDEKELRTECMQILSTLVRLGREFGLRIIYATQRPDKYTLPMTIRSQLENTLCFRVKEHYDSEIVLGHKGAEKLPHIPGRFIFQTPDFEIPVQAVYVSNIEDWLRQYGDKVDASTGLSSSMSTPVAARDWW